VREVRPLRAYADVVLGRQRSPKDDVGPHMARYLRAANVKDGYLELEDVKEMNFSPEEQLAFALAPGDVLVTEGSGSLTAVGASSVWNGELDGTVCFQNTLLRLRPRSSTDSRFLAWWCRYAFADGLFASAATGANIYHLSAERLRALPVRYLPLARQRAIADYLDTETARIDALIAKKQRMIELSSLRWRRHLLDVVAPHMGGAPVPEGWMQGRLRNLVDRVVGGSWGAEPGETSVDAPCVRAADFNFPRLSAEGGALRSYGWSEMQSRVVRPGDLVIEKSGGGDEAPVGRVVMWLGEDDAVPTNFAARLRPTDAHDPWFVLLAFRAAYEAGLNWRSIKQTTGIQNLDTGAYLSEPWPIPPLDVQQRVASDLRARLGSTMTLRDVLQRQIGLLREHRQALITAAVTGELQVPGVAA
jgi:type I restriction enzyme S subunit